MWSWSTNVTDRRTDRQTDGRTDRRTTCNLNTALCTSASRGKNGTNERTSCPLVDQNSRAKPIIKFDFPLYNKSKIITNSLRPTVHVLFTADKMFLKFATYGSIRSTVELTEASQAIDMKVVNLRLVCSTVVWTSCDADWLLVLVTTSPVDAAITLCTAKATTSAKTASCWRSTWQRILWKCHSTHSFLVTWVFFLFWLGSTALFFLVKFVKWFFRWYHSTKRIGCTPLFTARRRCRLKFNRISQILE